MAENMDQARRDDKEKRGEGWVSLIIRFVIAAIVLMVTAWLTPGFSRMGFGTALVAALVIAAMDWVVQRVFKIEDVYKRQ